MKIKIQLHGSHPFGENFREVEASEIAAFLQYDINGMNYSDKLTPFVEQNVELIQECVHETWQAGRNTGFTYPSRDLENKILDAAESF